MKLYKYSEADLILAVSRSTSMRQTLINLQVAPHGGNYDVLRRAIAHFGLDTSHFKGQAWNKGKKLPARKTLAACLVRNSNISSYKLKQRLLRERIFEARCSNCNRSDWLGQPIPLELDHINGDNKDNRLKNLRLLCPNCHAFTPTYRSKKPYQCLARDYHQPNAEASPNLTPFTPAVSAPGAQTFKSLASTNFAIRAG